MKISKLLNKKPVCIVIAGPNGSGKTSLTLQLLKHNWVMECEYINPDLIAEKELGDWNDEKKVLEAAKIATQRRNEYLENRTDFIFETVFSSAEKVEFLKKAREAGFFIRLFFVGTNHPSINAARVAKRVIEGGHDVPINKIINRYYKAINNCTLIAPLVDRLYIYDNSIDDAAAKLLFRAKNGTLEKVYGEINEWAAPILTACEIN